MEFEQALTHVLRHEGGYVDHPSDPGGQTNFGVTIAVARAHGYTGPMRDIPMSVVRDIYRRSYWNAARCDDLPASVRLIHFDSAVNSGVSRAARWLQTAAGVTADGVIGPITLRAATAAGPGLAMRYASVRLSFLAGLGTFGTFGRGWTRRVADVIAHSA